MLNILLMSPPPGGESPNMIFTILPWLAIFVVFYFFMIRPQTQKVKKQELFKKGLSKGDKIVTIGGIHGKIVEALEDKKSMVIETEGGHKLRIERSAVSAELTQEILK